VSKAASPPSSSAPAASLRLDTDTAGGSWEEEGERETAGESEILDHRELGGPVRGSLSKSKTRSRSRTLERVCERQKSLA
jgi:hypothetical protein